MSRSPLTFDPTTHDALALQAFEAESLAAGTKGWPLDAEALSAATIAEQRWTVWGTRPLPTPLLLLREHALRDNVRAMAQFAATQGVLFAPHAKTTMAPRLIADQIRAGCWAVTAATPAHVRTYRRFGIGRILLANQLVDPAAIGWTARELDRDPSFELICLVDSVAGVRLLEAQLAAVGAQRPLPVLMEIGEAGGRAGARSATEARAIADAAAAAAHVELVGIECFEGLAMDANRVSQALADVDRQLAGVRAIAEQLHSDGALGAQPLASAGGSAYFDRVLAQLRDGPWRLVLRSGCYVSQDGGFYDLVSPLAGRAVGARLLSDALELWATVLSRPQTDLIVVDAGKRDAPYDVAPPQPVAWQARGAAAQRLDDARVERLSDQHMTVSIPPSASIAIGDRVRFAISHPCGAFDRWTLIPVVDEADAVVAAVRTCF